MDLAHPLADLHSRVWPPDKTKRASHRFWRNSRFSSLFQERQDSALPQLPAIPCAWCGKSIWPGDPVTLYTPLNKNYQPASGVVTYRQEPRLFVGCLRRNCANSGMDRSGFWVPPGQVLRVMSPFEMVIATDEVVIIGDLTDPSLAIPLPEKQQ